MGGDISKCVITHDEARSRLGVDRVREISRQLTLLGGTAGANELRADKFAAHFIRCAFPSVPADVARIIFAAVDVKGKGYLTPDEVCVAVALLYEATPDEQVRLASLLAALSSAVVTAASTTPAAGAAATPQLAAAAAAATPQPAPQPQQPSRQQDRAYWLTVLHRASELSSLSCPSAAPVRAGSLQSLPVGDPSANGSLVAAALSTSFSPLSSASAPRIHAMERSVAEFHGLPPVFFDNMVDAHAAWKARNTENCGVVDARLVRKTTCGGGGGVGTVLSGGFAGGAAAPPQPLDAPAAPADGAAGGVAAEAAAAAGGGGGVDDQSWFTAGVPIAFPTNNHKSVFNVLFHAFYSVLLAANNPGVISLLDLVEGAAVWKTGQPAKQRQQVLSVFRHLHATMVELYDLMDARFGCRSGRLRRQRRFLREMLFLLRRPSSVYATLSLYYVSAARYEGSGCGRCHPADGDHQARQQSTASSSPPLPFNCNVFSDLDLAEAKDAAVTEEMIGFAHAFFFGAATTTTSAAAAAAATADAAEAEAEETPAAAAPTPTSCFADDESQANEFAPTEAQWAVFLKEFDARFVAEEEEEEEEGAAGRGEGGGGNNSSTSVASAEGAGGLCAGVGELLSALWHVALVELYIRPESRAEEALILRRLQEVTPPSSPAYSYYVVQAEWWSLVSGGCPGVGAAQQHQHQHHPHRQTAQGANHSHSGGLAAALPAAADKVNESLLAPGSTHALRPDARRDVDYAVVTRGAWKACCAWHRVGPPLLRRQVAAAASSTTTTPATTTSSSTSFLAAAAAADLERNPLVVRCVVGSPPPKAAPPPPMDPLTYITRQEHPERQYPSPPAQPAAAPQQTLAAASSSPASSSASASANGQQAFAQQCWKETTLTLVLPGASTFEDLLVTYFTLLLKDASLEGLVSSSVVERLQRSLCAVQDGEAAAAAAVDAADVARGFTTNGVRVYSMGRDCAEVLLGESVADSGALSEGELFLVEVPPPPTPPSAAAAADAADEEDDEEEDSKDSTDKGEAAAATAAAVPTETSRRQQQQQQPPLRYGTLVEAFHCTLADSSYYRHYYGKGLSSSSSAATLPASQSTQSLTGKADAAAAAATAPAGPTTVPETNKSAVAARGVVREVLTVPSGKAGEEGCELLYMNVVGKDVRRWVKREWVSAVVPDGELWPDCGGRIGLYNLGNTCYMSAALQCLSHTTLLRDYFLRHAYHAWDVQEETSWEGMNGQIAIAFSELLESLWGTADGRGGVAAAQQQKLLGRGGAVDGASQASSTSGSLGHSSAGGGSSSSPAQQPQPSAISPQRFRKVAGTFDPEYSYNRQQDAHEFLGMLLSALKMDLAKRCTTEFVEYKDAEGRSDPDVADERWHDYVMRQNSIVTKVFTAQFKSATSCTKCHRELRTFETLDMLQVPLPEHDHTFQTVYVHPKGAAIKMSLKVSKAGSTVQHLLERVEAALLLQAGGGTDTTAAASEHDAAAAGRPRASTSSAGSRGSTGGGGVNGSGSSGGSRTRCCRNRYVAVTLARNETAVGAALPATTKLADLNPNAKVHLYLVSDPMPDVNVTADPSDAARFQEVVHRKKTVVAGSECIVGARMVQCRPFPAVPTLIPTLGALCANGVGGASFDGQEFVSRVYEEVWVGARWMMPEYHLEYMMPEEAGGGGAPASAGNGGGGSLKHRYPFVLRIVGADGSGCIRCDWVKGCPGCVYDPIRHGTVLRRGEKLAADWNETLWNEYGNVKLVRAVEQHSSVACHREEIGKGITTTLPFCLDSYAREETLSMKCPRCEEETTHTSKIQLYRLPPVFVVHLKRFLYAMGNGGVKLNGLVDFPVRNFDLTPWCCPDSPHVSGTKPIYELYAVIYHKGSLSYGHYYSHILSEGKWWCFDDTDVTEISEAQVVTAEAYVLLYRKADEAANHLPSVWPAPEGYPANAKDVFRMKTSEWNKAAATSSPKQGAAGGGGSAAGGGVKGSGGGGKQCQVM